MTSEDFVRLASRYTVARMLERDDYKSQEQPAHLDSRYAHLCRGSILKRM
jgi:hypothetical protein